MLLRSVHLNICSVDLRSIAQSVQFKGLITAWFKHAAKEVAEFREKSVLPNLDHVPSCVIVCHHVSSCVFGSWPPQPTLCKLKSHENGGDVSRSDELKLLSRRPCFPDEWTHFDCSKTWMHLNGTTSFRQENEKYGANEMTSMQ